jgi:hypothetical protein
MHQAHHRQFSLRSSFILFIHAFIISASICTFFDRDSTRLHHAGFKICSSCKSDPSALAHNVVVRSVSNILQLPRNSPITRFSKIRQPTPSIFSRYASTGATGGEEKIKGQVIGIDLGKSYLIASSLLCLDIWEMLTQDFQAPQTRQ